MKQIFNFLKTNRHAILWAVGYIAVMWVVLRYLFDFNMFSRHEWIRVSHAHLHGFHGFVFGILLLAAAPMYIATTLVVFRTKKPLLDLPIPKTIVDAFAPPPPPPAPAQSDDTTDTIPDKTHEFHDSIPHELHGAFLRSRNATPNHPVSAFDMSRVQFGTAHQPATPVAQAAPVATPIPVAIPAAQGAHTTPPAPRAIPATQSTDMTDDFPLPTNFDFSNQPDDDAISVPTFSDITFDTPDASDTVTATPVPDSEISRIMQHLQSAGHTPTRDGDLIICNNMVIATHCDNDFWIADDIDWFANGKQRPSPIAELTARAAANNLTPVLYLGATNIMDLETCIGNWAAAGIRIITDLDELI